MNYFTGWWFQPLSKKKVSWDNCSQLNGKIKHIPNHQPVVLGIPPFSETFIFSPDKRFVHIGKLPKICEPCDHQPVD